MISKQRITDEIVDMGETEFFDSLMAVVKDREIHEWLNGEQNAESKAYQHARDASTCMALVAYHIKECTKSGLPPRLTLTQDELYKSFLESGREEERSLDSEDYRERIDSDKAKK